MQSNACGTQGKKSNSNLCERTMKQVKVNPVRYQMLTELAKGSRKNIENYLGDLIDSIYAKKK
tara:strand:+ start:399 stop:587 length:189 start_codon:yes stop_codon:yes gene_type:complete